MKMDALLNGMKATYGREQNKVYTMMNTNLEEVNEQKKYLDSWMENDDEWKSDFTDVMNDIQERYDQFPAFIKRVEARLNASLAEIGGALAGIQRTEQSCKQPARGLGRVEERVAGRRREAEAGDAQLEKQIAGSVEAALQDNEEKIMGWQREQGRGIQKLEDELRKVRHEGQPMKKRMEGADNDGEAEGDAEVFVMRDVGQSEQSSALTRLNVGRSRKGKQRTKTKTVGVRCSENEGVHEGQCSGAPPFVVPLMQFHIGK